MSTPAPASARATTDAPRDGSRDPLAHGLRPHFDSLAAFASTNALHASPLYRELRPQIERVLDAVVVEQLRDECDAPHVSPAAAPHLRAVAWNIERGIKLDGVKDLLASRPELANADLLLLTEVDHGMARSNNADVAREIARTLNYNYAFAPCYLALDKGNGAEAHFTGENANALHGNALLSPHPLGGVHTLRLPNGKDKLGGTEKRLGSQRAIIADVSTPRGRVRAVCLHLDAHSSQAHRRSQMRLVLDHLAGLPDDLPTIIGGDWNTSGYNSSRAFYAIAGFWRRVLMGARRVIKHHYPYPERRFERALFRDLERRGYDYRTLNVSGGCTLHYDTLDPRTRAQMEDWIPLWCFPFIEWALAPTQGRCSIKLDWFAGRGIVSDPSSPPGVIGGLRDAEGIPVSDHDAIVLDFRTHARSESEPPPVASGLPSRRTPHAIKSVYDKSAPSRFTRGRALLLCLSILIGAACAHRASEPTNVRDSTAVTPVSVPDSPPTQGRARRATATPPTPNDESPYAAPVRLAVLADKRINESSGIVASRAAPDLFWTHNDSDREALLFLIDRRGRTRATFVIPGVRPEDWEDIAAAPGSIKGEHQLYVGDIGDNSAQRKEIIVHRITEPAPPSDQTSPSAPRRTAPAETFRLRYPQGARDAETLLVHHATGDLYIITKQMLAPAEVYRARAPLDPRRTITLEQVATLDIPSLTGGFITGGDISIDNRRIILCDYVAAYEFVLPDDAKEFDAIWRERPRVVTLDARRQGEGIAYSLDGRAILTTSEGVPAPLGEVVRRR